MSPLDFKFKESEFTMHCVFSLFCCSLILTTSITITMWTLYHTVPFSLCSPFVDPSNKIVLMELVTYSIGVMHLFSIIFILSSYVILIRELKRAQKNLKGVRSRKQSNVPLIFQIIIVTASNILCWIPSDVVYIMAIFLDKYPINMVVWTTIAVTTINSVLNPIVFITTTLRKLYF